MLDQTFALQLTLGAMIIRGYSMICIIRRNRTLRMYGDPRIDRRGSTVMARLPDAVIELKELHNSPDIDAVERFWVSEKWDNLSTIEILTQKEWESVYKACENARPQSQVLEFGVEELLRRARNDSEKQRAAALHPKHFFTED